MAKIECVVEARDALGESCIWDPTARRVWWLDITKPCLQSFDPSTGRHTVHPLPGRSSGNAALRRSGGLVLAIDTGLFSFDPATGAIEELLKVEPDLPNNRFNDGRCDRRGRLWIGTMDTDLSGPSGHFYRIGADRVAKPFLNGIMVPNSTAFSPDDRTLYFSDTFQHAIWAFDFDIEAGEVSNRRVFADLTGRKGTPDGSCVDSEGFLWNAEFGSRKVIRYAPDGRVDRTVELPVTSPTCCCFGGDKLDTLYVVSATFRLTPEERAAEPFGGGLLALDVGIRGLPEAAFGG